MGKSINLKKRKKKKRTKGHKKESIIVLMRRTNFGMILDQIVIFNSNAQLFLQILHDVLNCFFIRPSVRTQLFYLIWNNLWAKSSWRDEDRQHVWPIDLSYLFVFSNHKLSEKLGCIVTLWLNWPIQQSLRSMLSVPIVTIYRREV